MAKTKTKGTGSLRMSETELAEYCRRNKKRMPALQSSPFAGKMGGLDQVEPRPFSTSVIFELTLPPSVNSIYQNVPGKGRVLTEKGREWKRRAIETISNTILAERFRYTIGQRLALHVFWHFRTDNQDIDNPVKILLDSIVAALDCDDKSKIVKRLYLDCLNVDKKNPRCVVKLRIMEDGG